MIDLLKEHVRNPHKIKIPLSTQEKAARLKYQITHEHELINQPPITPLEEILLIDEEQVFNLIQQGYNYEGLSATTDNELMYKLTKPRTIKKYSDITLILTQHKISYFLPGQTKATCVFEKNPAPPNINSLLAINQFNHTDTFQLIDFFVYLHIIGIRTIDDKSPLKNEILIIQLPTKETPPNFLDDYFYDEKICKKINPPCIVDGQK